MGFGFDLRSFLFAVAIRRGELRSPAGRRGRRPLRGGVNPSVFLARKIDLTFRQGMQPSQALCASSPEGRAKGWGAFLDICGEIRRGELRSPAGRVIYTSSVSLRLPLDVLLRKTRWSLATLFSRWRRLFSVACDLVLPEREARGEW